MAEGREGHVKQVRPGICDLVMFVFCLYGFVTADLVVLDRVLTSPLVLDVSFRDPRQGLIVLTSIRKKRQVRSSDHPCPTQFKELS